MSRPRIAIAGSGLAGLACAASLAPEAQVTVYERLPVVGGEQWSDAEHRHLIEVASARGVRFVGGTPVIRWLGDRVLTIGARTDLAEADILVVATGHRPATRAELGIEGDRCAAVLPATVAIHLLQQGVPLGRRPVVAAGGPWTTELCALLADDTTGNTATVTVVGPGVGPSLMTAGHRPAARVIATHGMPRITAVTVSEAGTTRRVACDCLILSASPQPYRNVDGAVLERPGVVFAQREAGAELTSVGVGERAADRARDLRTDFRAHSVSVIPRIGRPQR